jgi:hypothetical protein
MTVGKIVSLQIKLDEAEPAIMRRVEVPLTIPLDHLHLVLQAAMGWENYHLYEFRVRDTRWGIPTPEMDFGDGPLDAKKTRLIDVLQDFGVKSFKYVYDFGDDWRHSIRVGRTTDAVSGVAYPRLVEAVGHCPPEDVGGSWGYEEFLKVLADPDHEEYAERMEWAGGPFDPTDPEIEKRSQAVDRLTREWARKPAGRRKPSA